MRRYLLTIPLILLILCACDATPKQVPAPDPWPPEIGKEFPDLEVIDHTGKTLRLSEFKGKVLLIEPAGMPCAACQSFSGAEDYGPFPGGRGQGSGSLEKHLPVYGKGVTLDDPNLVFVQLLLYDMNMGPPVAKDASEWAAHFRMDQHPNRYVVVPASDLRNPTTYKIIPGMYLVDRNFVVRSDAAGHTPRDDLWRKLLPMVKDVLSERS